MKKINFYYEISADANMAQDELGNPCECYCAVGLEVELDEDAYIEHLETYEERATDFAEDLAEKFGVPASYLKPISEKEYIENTQDDIPAEF